MPKKTGIEFLKSVRKKHPDLPFILYTGKGSEEVASEAISAGVTDYLQKSSGTSQYTVLANRIQNVVEKYRFQEAIQTTEQKLSEIAERTDDSLFMYSSDWSELLFINSSYESIWGTSVEELESNPTSFLKYVHPKDQQRVYSEMEQVSSGNESQISFWIQRPDGEQRWVRADTRPIFDEDGTVNRIVGQVRDLTTEKKTSTAS